MSRYTIVLTACLALPAVLGACRSQPARYYTLSAVAAPAATPLMVPVSVGPISIPGIVDTSAIMVSAGGSEIHPDDRARWASPLRDNIAHAVAGDLSALLGSERVTLTADTWTEQPDYRVAIEVERFECAPGEAATLEAVWTVRATRGGTLREGRTTVREATSGADMGALAAAHSRALARLSADIAGAIRSLAGSSSTRP